MAESIGSRSVSVERPIPVTYDVGNLALLDPNIMDSDQFTDETSRETYLRSLARDSAQLLVNQILALPVVTGGRTGGSSATRDGVFVKLPEPVTQLPREKPVPVPKPLTKWEKFAKQKGISKARNTGNMIYDDEKGEWVKKWGYKGKNHDEPWLVEVDENGEAIQDSENGKSKKKFKKPTKEQSAFTLPDKKKRKK
ncbi:ribosomal biogenesis regulatory protein [Lipomyces oligophaga]|uniref:ribosomal biogenesis regulatory protein n=1 Tax=Lipomyces oligophaga TaxID=45792 RepID=UPI0034CFC361